MTQEERYKAAYEFLKGHLEWIQRNSYYPWLKEFSEMAISRCESEILDLDYDPDESY